MNRHEQSAPVVLHEDVGRFEDQRLETGEQPQRELEASDDGVPQGGSGHGRPMTEPRRHRAEISELSATVDSLFKQLPFRVSRHLVVAAVDFHLGGRWLERGVPTVDRDSWLAEDEPGGIGRRQVARIVLI